MMCCYVAGVTNAGNMGERETGNGRLGTSAQQ